MHIDKANVLILRPNFIFFSPIPQLGMKAVAPASEIWSLGVQHLLSPMLQTFAQASVWAFFLVSF